MVAAMRKGMASSKGRVGDFDGSKDAAGDRVPESWRGEAGLMDRGVNGGETRGIGLTGLGAFCGELLADGCCGGVCAALRDMPGGSTPDVVDDWGVNEWTELVTRSAAGATRFVGAGMESFGDET